MKKFIPYLLTLSLVGLTSAGVTLIVLQTQNQQKFKESIILDHEGEINKSWEVNLDGIYPGQLLQYNVSFDVNLASAYDISVNFVSTGEKDLANYVNVELLYNDESFASDILINFLDGDSFSVKNNNDPGDLTIKYSMPLETTNEAQAAEVDFKINIKVESVAL